jgi:hypothetical protein
MRRETRMDHERPEVIASYVEDELVAEVSVSRCYGRVSNL